MRLSIAVAFMVLGMACATRSPKTVKTEVITYPDGALIEYNGQPAGRAPAGIVLPQDSEGRLTGRAVVRALPNTKQDQLYAQTRTFDPVDRRDRVPNQIMIDMRDLGTNAPVEIAITNQVEQGTRTSGYRIPRTERSKPTQVLGLDRWDPGHH
jgi:hypothetical protein